jgi:hypothetical protein
MRSSKEPNLMFSVLNRLAKYDIKQKNEPACRRMGRQVMQRYTDAFAGQPVPTGPVPGSSNRLPGT